MGAFASLLFFLFPSLIKLLLCQPTSSLAFALPILSSILPGGSEPVTGWGLSCWLRSTRHSE